jgi:ornithine decarboxylase
MTQLSTAPAAASRHCPPPLTVQLAARLPHATPWLGLHLGEAVAAYRRLAEALPFAAIHYATKCNPDPSLLEAINGQGGGFEIASEGERRLLANLGIDDPEKILFSNPVKNPADIATAVNAGIDRFAFDSAQEATKISERAPGSRVYVRIRTDTSSAVPSEGKFGVPPDTAVDLMLYAARLGLTPYGIAFHVGSQQIDPGAWTAAIAGAAHVMNRLKTLGITLELLDLGGGFPVPMGDDTPVPSVGELGATIATELRDLPYPISTAIEPGRYIAAPAGVMVATVLADVDRDGVRWVHLDLGACTLIEALETQQRLRFPVTDSRRSTVTTPAHLTGPTCDSADTLMYDVPLSPGLQPGDRIYLQMAGAYTVSNGTFNGLRPPAIHVLDSPDAA